MEKKTENP